MPTAPYTGPSIVDYLSLNGKPSDYNSRAALAAKSGIAGYTGTAVQNTQLLNMLRGGAATPAPTGALPTTPTSVTTNPTPVTPPPTTATVPPPAVPTNTTTSGGATAGSVLSDPTANSNAMLQQVLKLMTPSTDETNLMKSAADLEASRKLSNRNIEDQPIALPFITGQEAAVDKRATDMGANITARLDIAKAQRLGALDAAKTVFDYSKPTTVGVGTNLVNPLTGQTVAQGQSYSGKTDYSTVAALMKAYPDAGIMPTDSPDIAADKVSNAPSFYSKNTSTVMKFDPASGTFITYQSKSLPNTNIGTGAGKTSGGSSTSSTVFGSPSGSSALAPGASGSNVTALQNWLISQGYSIPAGATGYYGDQTSAAVAKFQADHGVNTAGGGQGVFGPQTQSAASSKGFSLAGTMTSGGGQNGGTAGSTASTGNSFGLNPSNKIDLATLTYLQTGDMPSGIYPNDQTAVRARAQKVLPGFNPVIAKANAGAIAEQTKILANVSSAINTADDNFNLLITTAKKAGINDNSSPIINGIQNGIQKGYLGSGDLNQFNTGIQTLRTEYAQVLARGGEVTEGVRHESANLIPDNISLDNLQKVYNYIKQEGKNVIDERNKTIKSLSTGGTTNMGTNTSAPASTGSSDYQAYLKAIGQ